MIKQDPQIFYCLTDPEGLFDVRSLATSQGICESYAYNLHVMNDEDIEATLKRLRHMGYKFKGPCKLEEV